MKARLQRLLACRMPDWTVPLLLLGLCAISYSLLLRHLGYYWDDWPFIWISQKLGSAGMVRYFHTNRPLWGLIFQFTTPLLGHEPWHWHLFALTWRWIAAVSLWGLLRLIWPRQPQPALWASLLFAVYPGSQEQLVALVFSHFFIVLSAFFGSLSLSILALRRPRFYLPLTCAALLLSLVNLFTLEYFFLLELLRPALLWMTAGETQLRGRVQLARTLQHSLPYLLLFAGAAAWRAFLFPFQTNNYSLTLLEGIRNQPLQRLFFLLLTILKDLWLTSLGAWGQVFRLPNPAELGRLTTLVYAGVVIVTAAGMAVYLLLSTASHTADAMRKEWKPLPWALSTLLLGLLALFLAGWPFWLIELPVGLDFPNSRLTLSFMLGASLLAAGLIGMLPLPKRARLALLSVCLALAAGLHFQNASAFRRDNDFQKALFWQMSWRIPALEPGTSLLFDEMPLRYSTDNSLTATLNWIYAPQNNTAAMDYYLFYPSMRLGSSLPYLEEKAPFVQDYLAATFYGHTGQVLALEFSPPGCLRVLDAQIEPLNMMIPELMRYAASYATIKPILAAGEGQAAALQAEIFGEEPAHGWCYYFEKADLARQLGDWQQVAALGEAAFALDDHPNDPSERMPFIEGYAHVGDWARALELTEESVQVTELMQPMLCRLWERIETETPASAEKTDAMQQAEELLQCEATR